MFHTIENESLRVTIATRGAELVSVLDKRSGHEHIWQSDASVWAGSAPLLFPYCGRINGGEFAAKGERYPGARHGFARGMAFACTGKTAQQAAFALASSGETLRLFPYPFSLTVVFRLAGARLLQEVTVQNPQDAGGALPCSVGFHPGFALPLRQGAPTAAHSLRFDKPVRPALLETEDGLMTGKRAVLFEKSDTLYLNEELFAVGALVLGDLCAESVALCCDGTSAQVRVGLGAFPYLLLWSVPNEPMPFLCIEPWHSLPDPLVPYGDFSQKPGLWHIPPGAQTGTALELEFTV